MFVFLILGIGVLIFWCLRIPHFLPGRLRQLPQTDFTQALPSVTIVVAARNEEKDIERSVRALLAQQRVNHEIVVVNDRSTDDTGRILDRLHAEDPRVRVVHNLVLPEGWLGKCWALKQGASQATGDYLLFCDGDAVFTPTGLAEILGVCKKENLDHLTLVPRMITDGGLEAALSSSLFFLVFLFQNPALVFDRNRKGNFFGFGACNVVRRSLYESFGGHEPLKLEVLDDVFLGALAKRSGGSSGLYAGQRVLSLRWYSGVWDFVKGIEKNAFAGLGFSLKHLSLALVFQVLFFFSPPVMALVLPLTFGWPWLISTLICHVLFAVHSHRIEQPWQVAWRFLPGLFMQDLAICRSAFLTLKRKGIIWRETFYSTDSLRQAQLVLRGGQEPASKAQ